MMKTKHNNITFIGMPASGKSSIGIVLAKRLGMQFIDVDLVIQEKTGMLLKEIIAKHGDEGFRKIEDDESNEIWRYIRWFSRTYEGCSFLDNKVRRTYIYRALRNEWNDKHTDRNI